MVFDQNKQIENLQRKSEKMGRDLTLGQRGIKHHWNLTKLSTVIRCANQKRGTMEGEWNREVKESSQTLDLKVRQIKMKVLCLGEFFFFST